MQRIIFFCLVFVATPCLLANEKMYNFLNNGQQEIDVFPRDYIIQGDSLEFVFKVNSMSLVDLPIQIRILSKGDGRGYLYNHYTEKKIVTSIETVMDTLYAGVSQFTFKAEIPEERSVSSSYQIILGNKSDDELMFNIYAQRPKTNWTFLEKYQPKRLITYDDFEKDDSQIYYHGCTVRFKMDTTDLLVSTSLFEMKAIENTFTNEDDYIYTTTFASGYHLSGVHDVYGFDQVESGDMAYFIIDFMISVPLIPEETSFPLVRKVKYKLYDLLENPEGRREDTIDISYCYNPNGEDCKLALSKSLINTNQVKTFPTVVEMGAKLNVQLEREGLETIQGVVYDSQGRNILTQRLTSQNMFIEIDERFKSGIYFFLITSQNGTSFHRFIVSH